MEGEQKDTVIPYLKTQINIWITWHEFCWHQHLSTGNQQILLYHEIDIDWNFTQISICFNFFWVFKDCFKKNGYNFDDVRKMAALFYKDLSRKTNFLGGSLALSSIIWEWQQLWPWNFAPMWSQEVFGTNFYVCRR